MPCLNQCYALQLPTGYIRPAMLDTPVPCLPEHQPQQLHAPPPSWARMTCPCTCPQMGLPDWNIPSELG